MAARLSTEERPKRASVAVAAAAAVSPPRPAESESAPRRSAQASPRPPSARASGLAPSPRSSLSPRASRVSPRRSKGASPRVSIASDAARRKGRESKGLAPLPQPRGPFPAAWTPYYPVPKATVAKGDPTERSASVHVAFDLEALWTAEEAADFAPFERCAYVTVDRSSGVAVLKEDLTFGLRHFGTDYTDAPTAAFEDEAWTRSILSEVVQGYRLLQQPNIDFLILRPPLFNETNDADQNLVRDEWLRRLYENRVDLLVEVLAEVSGLPRHKISWKVEVYDPTKHSYGFGEPSLVKHHKLGDRGEAPGVLRGVFSFDVAPIRRARAEKDLMRKQKLRQIERRDNWYFDLNSGVLMLLKDDVFMKKRYHDRCHDKRDSVSAVFNDEGYTRELLADVADVHRLFPTSLEVVRSQEVADVRDHGEHGKWSQELANNRAELARTMLVELGVPPEQVSSKGEVVKLREGQGMKFSKIRCYDRIAAKTALLKAMDNPSVRDVPQLRKAMSMAEDCQLTEAYPDMYLTEARDLLQRLEVKKHCLHRQRSLRSARSLRRLQAIDALEDASVYSIAGSVPSSPASKGFATRRGRSSPPPPLRESSFSPLPAGPRKTPRRKPMSPRSCALAAWKPGGCPLGFETFSEPHAGTSAF
eukprot:TRINITY_DN28114_c0_g1_i2.p1 TRINITY_DN28114_c0_g1~~TRINITY_DN28114_c0_g1_i2.p1  ORF type:complete len:646 (+),score=129.23 TRINITY_DN28114_c0_g1_i2:78-2015(+)